MEDKGGKDMRVVAVLDRFDGERGVLLVGQDEEEWKISRSKLPENVRVGDVIQVEMNIDIYATLLRSHS